MSECAPNPTTGFFFYVPKSKIIEVDMGTDDAAFHRERNPPAVQRGIALRQTAHRSASTARTSAEI